MQAIYCIENKISGKRYIDSSVNFYKRKKSHLKSLRDNIHHSPYLQNSWNKYDEENFIFIVLEKVEVKQKLIEREQWWIDNSNSDYNICKIAGNSLGVKRRPETIEKVRQANLGLKHPEWRNKIKSKAQGGDNHWTKKKKFSEEAKKKMSQSQKALYKNGYINPLKRRVYSQDEIEKQRRSSSKAILMLDAEGNIIKEFESAKQAYLKEGFSPQYIGQCCNLKRKKYKGYVWKFKE